MKNCLRITQFTVFATWILVTTFPHSASAQKTTLKKLIALAAGEDKDLKGSSKFERLESEWIGDVTGSDGQVTKLRLEYGKIMNGNVQLARMFNDRYLGSDAPIYIEKLPKGKELKKLKTVKELEVHFGQSRGFSSGWGSDERMHYSVGWTFITREEPSRLRYLSVFALVSRAGKPKADAQVDIDELSFSEGILRPADPESKAEEIEYPSGEALFVAEEEKKKKEREKYPLPLRNLIEADEHPNDSDLAHYRRHLNAIRENPDPKLFRQLLAVIDEGTLARRGNLEAILVDSWHDLDPWKPDHRKLAIKACIEGIPLVKESARSGLMVILLKANGGGTIEFGTKRIEVTIKENGSSERHGSASGTVSLEETQRQLMKMLIEE